MKRLDYTKVSVKLKKSEWRDEWFIYLEAYPVYETGNDKPKRVREYLRRSITTPIWDKRRSERAVAGRIKYKPKPLCGWRSSPASKRVRQHGSLY